MPSVWDPPVTSFKSNFSTTHWSVVLAASGAGASEDRAAEARAAMEQLCRVYWPPIYSFLRREGRSVADAEQLTQEFFTGLIALRSIDSADPERGRFRSWLLQCLKNFLSNQRVRELRQNRDKRKEVWMDGLDAEERYQLEPRHNSNPEHEYQRDCAIVVLEKAFARLKKECDARGRGWLFEQIRQTLTLGPDEAGYAVFAPSVDMTPGNLKVTIAHWRKRWVYLVRELVSASVDVADARLSRSEAIQAELEFLLSSLTSNRPS